MRTAGHHAEGELDGPAAADRTERVDHEVAVDQREEHLWRRAGGRSRRGGGNTQWEVRGKGSGRAVKRHWKGSGR